MIDFKELDKDGNDFELLIREILYNKGLEVYWSGKGIDGGKDLLCIERPKSCFKSVEKRWVVQCKHNAHSGKAVSAAELEDIAGVCDAHNADGYILACTTYPSSSLVQRFEQIQSNRHIAVVFWDARTIERELLCPDNWDIANIFFPKSMNNFKWKINAVEPGLWYANYNGNIFYMAARLGTNCDNFLIDMENIIFQIKEKTLQEDCLLRLRAAYFDEKNTNYKIYLDYLMPLESGEGEYFLENTVKQYDLDEIIDGVAYEFDIMTYRYNKESDHFDMDHKDYYNEYLDTFKCGGSRDEGRRFVYANPISTVDISEENVNTEFDKLCEVFRQLPFIFVLKVTNAKIEFIDQFSEHFSWNNLITEADYDVDNFFDAQIRLECYEFEKLKSVINVIPQSVEKHFELCKNYIVLPDTGLEEVEDGIFTLKFSIHPAKIGSKTQFRVLMNQYLREIRIAVSDYIKKN